RAGERGVGVEAGGAEEARLQPRGQPGGAREVGEGEAEAVARALREEREVLPDAEATADGARREGVARGRHASLALLEERRVEEEHAADLRVGALLAHVERGLGLDEAEGAGEGAPVALRHEPAGVEAEAELRLDADGREEVVRRDEGAGRSEEHTSELQSREN